jgi:hypothetical protein
VGLGRIFETACIALLGEASQTKKNITKKITNESKAVQKSLWVTLYNFCMYAFYTVII